MLIKLKEFNAELNGYNTIKMINEFTKSEYDRFELLSSKWSFVKDNIDVLERVKEGLSEEDQELLIRIRTIQKILPKEKHKCIGCMCMEFEYPEGCNMCPFEFDCRCGKLHYPEACYGMEECIGTLEMLRAHEKDKNVE